MAKTYRIVKKYSSPGGAKFAAVENTETGRRVDVKTRGKPPTTYTMRNPKPLGQVDKPDTNDFGDPYPFEETRTAMIADKAREKGL